LPGLDGFKVCEAIGNQGHEVFEQDRLSTKNQNRYLSLSQILLVFESAINGQHNVESCGLGRGQSWPFSSPAKPAFRAVWKS